MHKADQKKPWPPSSSQKQNPPLQEPNQTPHLHKDQIPEVITSFVLPTYIATTRSCRRRRRSRTRPGEDIPPIDHSHFFPNGSCRTPFTGTWAALRLVQKQKSFPCNLG
ncbi:hypothetical protein LINGRAHAP2_LOCUS19176 [Linum grandiflorum]